MLSSNGRALLGLACFAYTPVFSVSYFSDCFVVCVVFFFAL